MPDGYTHVATGNKALKNSNFKASSLLAFGAGTNGPDALFFYKVWKKNKKPDLLSIGSMMHKNKTGNFLISLVKNADSPTKKSFVAGFLTHYATDKTAHPYVAFLTDTKNAPYNIPHGHGFYECTLDSELHKVDYGTRIVEGHQSSPTPPKDELLEIAELLHIALLETYNEDISQDMLVECYYDMLRMRKLFISRIGIRRGIFYIAERLIFKEPGYILSNLSPGHKLKTLPSSWKNPFTGQKCAGGMKELLIEAQAVGTEFINKVNDYWNNNISLEEFRAIIGNKSYETGLEL